MGKAGRGFGGGRAGQRAQSVGSGGSSRKGPDWACGECKFASNFSSRGSCWKCSAKRPPKQSAARGSGDGGSSKPPWGERAGKRNSEGVSKPGAVEPAEVDTDSVQSLKKELQAKRAVLADMVKQRGDGPECDRPRRIIADLEAKIANKAGVWDQISACVRDVSQVEANISRNEAEVTSLETKLADAHGRRAILADKKAALEKQLVELRVRAAPLAGAPAIGDIQASLVESRKQVVDALDTIKDGKVIEGTAVLGAILKTIDEASAALTACSSSASSLAVSSVPVCQAVPSGGVPVFQAAQALTAPPGAAPPGVQAGQLQLPLDANGLPVFPEDDARMAGANAEDPAI